MTCPQCIVELVAAVGDGPGGTFHADVCPMQCGYFVVATVITVQEIRDG